MLFRSERLYHAPHPSTHTKKLHPPSTQLGLAMVLAMLGGPCIHTSRLVLDPYGTIHLESQRARVSIECARSSRVFTSFQAFHESF